MAATPLLDVIFTGLVGIVLQDPNATMIDKPFKVALVDGSQVSDTQHHPVLVVDLDLVESNDNGMITGIDDASLPERNRPYTISDPSQRGELLLVWPLEGLEVSFQGAEKTSSMPLNTALLPDLYKAAKGNGEVAPESLDLVRNNLLSSLVTLDPGFNLTQEGPTTIERWCFSTDPKYFKSFYLAAKYSAEVKVDNQVQIDFKRPFLAGSYTGYLRLRAAKENNVFELGISNDPTLTHGDMESDKQHVQALCALVGLGLAKEYCPFPKKESGGECGTGGGGTGTGLGCSPFIIKGK